MLIVGTLVIKLTESKHGVGGVIVAIGMAANKIFKLLDGLQTVGTLLFFKLLNCVLVIDQRLRFLLNLCSISSRADLR